MEFNNFLETLKKDCTKYFECECISQSNDDEEISFKMSNDLSKFDEERACGNFDNGYEQWHINQIYINKNKVTFSYRDLDKAA